MIFLFGESAAARELSNEFKSRGFKSVQKQVWAGEPLTPMPSLIIDASHPSMSSKFIPLREWSERTGIPFIRLERPETNVPASPLIFPVYQWEEAMLKLEQRIKTLNGQKGRSVTIFITTGSYQLSGIAAIAARHSARLVIRVLPEGRLLDKCREAGIAARDIIAMQGPFSKEINRSLYKFYGADLILTRDSGQAGGTDTKISAALDLGLEIILIRKPKSPHGLSASSTGEILTWVEQNLRN